jgi:uncharacterized protein (TIGR02285 family)
MRFYPFRKSMCLFGGLAFLLTGLAVPLSAQETTITWKISNWPPVYILEGPYAAQGAGDALIRFYAKRMPEYRHKTSNMSITRFYHEAQQGSRVCNVAGFPINGVLASLPNSVIVPHHIIIRRDKADLLTSTDQVSLKQLLSDQRLTAGLTRGRYGKLLNPIIDSQKESAHITHIPEYNNIIKMLFAGRIDYTIEYPPVIRYFEKLHDRDNEVLIIPIDEVVAAKPFLTAFVVCPQNQWGEQVIARVNRIIREERNSYRYREILLRWYDAQTRRQVGKYLDEAFAKLPP